MLLSKALSHWSLPPETTVALLAERENRVYRVDEPSEGTRQPTILRVHRQGYRSDAEVLSELQWMTHLADNGLTVPSVIPTNEKALLVDVDGFQIDRLTWLTGQPMGRSNQPLNIPDRTGTFKQIGETMARLHKISDDWQLPENFTRTHWDHDGFLGGQPLWDRFWDNPQLTMSQRDLLIAARDKASQQLKSNADSLDYGLIHADIVRENILLSDDGIQLLDFDDGGFGFRLFDVATTLFKNRIEPGYPDLEKALLEGYHSVRPLDVQSLPLLTLLRSFTYVGWIISRIHENGSQQRADGFIATATELAEEYLTA